MSNKRKNSISLHVKDDELFQFIREDAFSTYGNGYGSISKYICHLVEKERVQRGIIHENFVAFLKEVKDNLLLLEKKDSKNFNLIESEHPDTPTWFFNEISVAVHPLFDWTHQTATKITNLSMAASCILNADSLVIITSKFVSEADLSETIKVRHLLKLPPIFVTNAEMDKLEDILHID